MNAERQTPREETTETETETEIETALDIDERSGSKMEDAETDGQSETEDGDDQHVQLQLVDPNTSNSPDELKITQIGFRTSKPFCLNFSDIRIRRNKIVLIFST